VNEKGKKNVIPARFSGHPHAKSLKSFNWVLERHENVKVGVGERQKNPAKSGLGGIDLKESINVDNCS
jgi:hypothetical protein